MKGKAIVTGTPFSSYTVSVAEALNENGIDTVLLEYPFPNLVLKNLKYISWIYEQLFRLYYSNKFLRICLKNGKDREFLLIFGMNHFSVKQILKIKQCTGMKIVLWFIDSIQAFAGLKNLIDVSDIILTYNKSDLKQLKHKSGKCRFVPLAYDHHFYFPLKDPVKIHDIYFIGSLKSRIGFFEALFEKIANLNLRIRIDGKLNFWFIIRNRKRYPLFFRYYSGKNLDHRAINDIYNSSRICLNIQPVQAESGFSIRTFEICGAGGLQMTNGNRELLDTLFETGREIIYFEDINDLVKKIKDIFSSDGEGLNGIISKRGHSRALSDHTFKKRLAEIAEFIHDN